MIRFLEFIIAVVVVVVVFVIVGVFLPAERTVEHSVETNRPTRLVIDTLSGFGRFGDWHPMRGHDPHTVYDVSGPELGEGARLDYRSDYERVGSGSWELVEVTESTRGGTLRFALDDGRYGENKTMLFRVERRGRITTIHQRYSVEYGWNLFGRYAGLYVARNVGDDIARGLRNFAAVMAQTPNIDYTNLRVERVELPAQNILYIRTEAPRQLQDVETAQVTQLRWLRQAMERNNLEAAGPWRTITTNFGSDVYEFDVAIPVCRRGSCPERPGRDADGEDEDVTEGENIGIVLDVPVDVEAPLRPGAEALPPAEPIDPETLELVGDVRFGRSYEGPALKAIHNGHPASLPVVREQLRAWAASRALQVTDRAFEEYLQDIEDSDPERSEYNVYWPIR